MKLAGLPETIIPEEGWDLNKYRNVRKAALKVLAGREHTFQSMREVLAVEHDDLTNMCKWWDFDQHFLLEHAEMEAAKVLHDKLVAVLPSETSRGKITIAWSLEQVIRIEASPLAQASSDSVQTELKNTRTILVNLSKGISPKDHAVQAMSGGYKKILARCEHFLTPTSADFPNRPRTSG